MGVFKYRAKSRLCLMTMNYKELYKTLPAATQKAIRELMKTLNQCDRKPIMSSDTICQSRLETATNKVQICTAEIERYCVGR